MISSVQTFECISCGDEVKSITMDDCDRLEGSKCNSCDDGYYQWTGPAEYDEAARPESLFDDVDDNELDRAFEDIMTDER